MYRRCVGTAWTTLEIPMTAYVVSLVEVSNAAQYAEYVALAGPIVAGHGGTFVARGGERRVLEGSLALSRVVIVEFPSMEAATQCYGSPEYLAAREKRVGAADFHSIVTAGAGAESGQG
jgi:uncharacterized protein (DUF1330 family)